jgi:tetrahydromethanopterin:alpha-L-glutamate ligase
LINIPIFTDDPGWHGAQLRRAFAHRGVDSFFVSLQDCLLDFSGKVAQIRIPSLQDTPKAVFVRGVTGGTLPQVITRLNVLHMLKLQGVLVYNDGRAIERTVDKAMTSFLLQQAGIATPKTWICESRQQAHAIMQTQSKLVIKPLFGSQGKGVRLVDKAHLPLPMDCFVDGVFYLQEWLAAPHDYRVFVVNGQVLAAMKRTGEDWLHNVAQGARCEQTDEPDVLAIALLAASVLEIAYCGVDVIRDENGQLSVLEVNSIPAWRGLQSVAEVDVAQALVDDFLSQMNQRGE